MDNNNNPLAGLVPDYSTIDPAEVTKGQPPYENPVETAAQVLSQVGPIADAKRIANVLGGAASVVGSQISDAALQTAKNAAMAPSLPVGMRTMAAEYVAGKNAERAEQAAQALQPDQQQIELNEALQAAGLAPATAAQPVPTDLNQKIADIAAEPTVEEKVKAAQTQLAPVRQAIAEQSMFDKAQQELAKAQAEAAKREADLQKQVENLDKEAAEEARARSLPQIMQNGSWGSKIAASIAVLVGGISQGLTGHKTNPALDVIDKEVERQTEKDKLRADQKLALRRELLQNAQTKIQTISQMTDNAYKKAQLQNAYQELELKRQETTQKLLQGLQQQALQAGLYAGAEISDQAMAALKPEERAQVVSINGKRYMANNHDSAKKLQEEISNGTTALSKLKPYQQFVEKGGLSTFGEKGLVGYYKDKNAADTLKVAIVGALRLPFTGPGILTDSEREMLIKNIGDFGIFNLPVFEKEKLKVVIKDIESRMQSSAESAGIKVPVVSRAYVKTSGGRMISREDYIDQVSRNSGLSKDQVEAALKKQGR